MKRLRHRGMEAVAKMVCAGVLVVALAPPAPAAAAPPGAPTITSVTAGNRRAEVVWNAPASDGGSPITGYVVTPFRGATPQQPTQVDSAATTATVTGLSNGATYTFTVAATNADGTGLVSAASNPVKPKGPGTREWYAQRRWWAVGLGILVVLVVLGVVVFRRRKPPSAGTGTTEPASSPGEEISP